MKCVSHNALYERIGALHARMDNVERSIQKIAANLDQLTVAANLGRGAWWGATKAGGLLVVTLGGLGWLWSQLRPVIEGWRGP